MTEFMCVYCGSDVPPVHGDCSECGEQALNGFEDVNAYWDGVEELDAMYEAAQERA